MEQQLRSWSASDEHDLWSKHHFDESTGSLNIYWEYQGITERKYSHEGGGGGGGEGEKRGKEFYDGLDKISGRV